MHRGFYNLGVTWTVPTGPSQASSGGASVDKNYWKKVPKSSIQNQGQHTRPREQEFREAPSHEL